MIEDLFSQNELDATVSLNGILSLLDQGTGVVAQIRRVRHYSDEPKPYKYIALAKTVTKEISDGQDFKVSGVGYSFFSEEEALVKCIGETVERYCLKIYKNKDFTFGSYGLLKRSGAVNPEDVVSFTETQRKKLKNTDITSADEFGWVEGYSLTSGRQALIPAQLVYLSYVKKPSEKIIRLPLSTGAAGGTCLASAICRGIYEVVERDAFMIHWLNKITPPKVIVQSIPDSRIKKILQIYNRYLLKVNVLDITTDVNIPTYLTVLIDKTGIGLPISLGLKSHLDPISAILGSMHEALNPREWMRREAEDNPSDIKNIKSDQITTIKSRGLFWFDKNKMKEVSFLIKQKATKNIRLQTKPNPTSGEQLSKLLKILSRNNYEVYFTDIGLPSIKKHNYEVVSVLIPKLQPLYLNEKYPYLGGERLYQRHEKNNMEMNLFPHPFL